MITSMAMMAISFAQVGALPDGVRRVLESQLPVWSQVMGDPAPSSESNERIAVERSTNSILNVFLIERKLKVVIQHEEERYWLTDVVWCGQGAGRCDDVWARTDEQWRSDKSTTNHTGYAVYRDSLRLSPTSWTDPVPSMALGKKKWDKGVCENGLCFVVSAKDSSVAHAAARPDGSVVFWDGGYILGGNSEKEMVHAYKYLLEQGHGIPFKKVGSETR